MKKITAILLAVLLVLSLSITAYAEETTNGTITVNGAVNGETYTLYKIFDVTEVNGVAAYSIPSGRNYSNTANFSTLFETNTDANGVTYVTRKTDVEDADIIAWAKANIASFGTAVTTEPAEDAKVEFTGLAQGYYYVASPVSNGAAAMIADTTQTATVVEKNSAPGWDKDDDTKGGKEANGVTYYAGETITYTLTYYSAVNYDNGEQVTKYIIEDTLPAGITYNGDVKVKVNDGDEFEPDSEGSVSNGFKVSIPWTKEDGTSKYTTNPSKIVVTYTATMGNTVIDAPITNAAKIYPDTQADDPDEEPNDETKREDTVYTGQIELTKVDIKDATKLLSGAKFKVKVVTTGKDTEGNTISVNGYLQKTNNGYTVVTEATAASVFVTGVDGEEGKITLKGLKAGTYTFVEIEAPAGYNLPATENTTPVELVVTDATEVEGTENTVTYGMSKGQTIQNSPAAAMPETGGMGTTLFYIVGSLMAIGAAILLITQKRMQSVR